MIRSLLVVCLLAVSFRPAWAVEAERQAPALAPLLTAHPETAVRAELLALPSWTLQPSPSIDPAQARTRRAVLAAVDAPQALAGERAALAAAWSPETLAAYDAAVARLAAEPALASRVRELRTVMDLAGLSDPGAPAGRLDHGFDGKAEGHVIVAAKSHEGAKVAELLARAGQRVVTLQGRQALDGAGVRRAKALIATADDDAGNLALIMEARRANPDLTIVARVFDHKLARQLESTLGLRKAVGMAELAAPVIAASVLGLALESSFDLDGHRYVAADIPVDRMPALAGRTVAQAEASLGLQPVALRRQGRVQLSPEGGETLRPGDVLVVAGRAARWRSALGLKTGLRDGLVRRARRLATSVVETLRPEIPFFITFGGIIAAGIAFFRYTMGLSAVDAYYFVLTMLTTTGFGDITLLNAPPHVKVVGTLFMLAGVGLMAALGAKLLAARLSRQPRHPVGDEPHVIVAGAGTVGFRVAEELMTLGKKVIAVEARADSELAELLRDEVPVVTGDAGREAVLRKARIGTAEAVVAATDDDHKNLSVAMLARRLNPSTRAVVRTADPDLARDAREALGVEAAHSSTALAAPTFAGAALHPDAATTLLLDEQLVHLVPRPKAPGSDERRFDVATEPLAPAR